MWWPSPLWLLLLSVAGAITLWWGTRPRECWRLSSVPNSWRMISLNTYFALKWSERKKEIRLYKEKSHENNYTSKTLISASTTQLLYRQKLPQKACWSETPDSQIDAWRGTPLPAQKPTDFRGVSTNHFEGVDLKSVAQISNVTWVFPLFLIIFFAHPHPLIFIFLCTMGKNGHSRCC